MFIMDGGQDEDDADFVFVAGGQATPGGGYLDTTERYTISSETSAAADSLTEGPVDVDQGGGNSSHAFMFGYFGAAPVHEVHEKYEYSSDTMSLAGDVLATQRFYTGAASSPAQILIAGGETPVGVELASTEKFAFSGETMSAGTGLSGERTEWGQGFGNRFKGYFTGGRASSVIQTDTDVYTYSNDTVASPASGLGLYNMASAYSNKANGYVSGGHTGGFFGAETEIWKYPYLTETWSAVTALFGEVGENGLIVACGTAIGNLGITAGGQNTGNVQDNVYKHNLGNDTVAVAGVLTGDRQGACMMSPQPAWY
jgi:hypothetical protein